MQREVQRLGARWAALTSLTAARPVQTTCLGRSHAGAHTMDAFWLRSGASALDKRTKQRLQAAELEKLGAKRQKGSRIPASIGLGAHC